MATFAFWLVAEMAGEAKFLFFWQAHCIFGSNMDITEESKGSRLNKFLK